MHDAIEYPPFAHSFTMPEITPTWLRDNCYVVTREHYAALLADRDALARRLAEAEALLRAVRDMWVEDCSGTAERIDALLAERKGGNGREAGDSDA